MSDSRLVVWNAELVRKPAARAWHHISRNEDQLRGHGFKRDDSDVVAAGGGCVVEMEYECMSVFFSPQVTR